MTNATAILTNLSYSLLSIDAKNTMPPSKKMSFMVCSADELDAMLAARYPEQNTKDILSKTNKELEKLAKECAAEQKEMETKRKEKFEIDLNDVPGMSPILKSGPVKEGQSKYHGVSSEKMSKKNPWSVRIWINGKDRHVGRYKSEEEAGADFVRAVFKYGSAEQKRKYGLTAGDESNAVKSGKKKDGERKEAVTKYTSAAKGKGGNAVARKKKSVSTSTAASKGGNATVKKGSAAAKRKKSVKMQRVEMQQVLEDKENKSSTVAKKGGKATTETKKRIAAAKQRDVKTMKRRKTYT